MTVTTVLEINDLSVRYGSALALDRANLTISEGSIVALLGANGAGKTTLARAACGLVSSAAGEVQFDGSVITNRSPEKIARAGLMYLPEGRGIFPGLSVQDNLKLATISVPRSERTPAIDKVVDYFPVLGKRFGQRAGSLSGGEQQMLSLARALGLTPKLVIADEMSLGLAPKMVDMVFEGLAAAASAGTTVVMIEQFVHRSLAMADSAVVLSRGRVRWSGPASEGAAAAEEHYMGGLSA